MRGRIRVVGFLFFVVGSRTVTAQVCQLYHAALGVIGARPDSTMLVDRSTMSLPQSALGAYVAMRRGHRTPLSATVTALVALTATRAPVPGCLAHGFAWRTISDSVLASFFSSSDKGWTAFRAAYPATPRIALVSQPTVTGDTAVIYVATASADAGAQSMMVRLVRNASGTWAGDRSWPLACHECMKSWTGPSASTPGARTAERRAHRLMRHARTVLIELLLFATTSRQ